jgi:hypothetical protein
MGLLGGVDIRSQRAALHRGRLKVRFHCDAALIGKVDHQPSIAHRMTGHVVPATPDRHR